MKRISGFAENEAAAEGFQVAALIAGLLLAGIAINLLAVAYAAAGFSFWGFWQ